MEEEKLSKGKTNSGMIKTSKKLMNLNNKRTKSTLKKGYTNKTNM